MNRKLLTRVRDGQRLNPDDRRLVAKSLGEDVARMMDALGSMDAKILWLAGEMTLAANGILTSLLESQNEATAELANQMSGRLLGTMEFFRAEFRKVEGSAVCPH